MSRPARVLALANQKGGVAKTTTTLNLGVGAQGPRRRVLAVDLDPQSNLSMSQGIDVESLTVTMYDVLTGSARAVGGHRRRARSTSPPAGIELAGAELALSVDDRPRARPRAGAEAAARPLRLHPDRHAARRSAC